MKNTLAVYAILGMILSFLGLLFSPFILGILFMFSETHWDIIQSGFSCFVFPYLILFPVCILVTFLFEKISPEIRALIIVVWFFVFIMLRPFADFLSPDFLSTGYVLLGFIPFCLIFISLGIEDVKTKFSKRKKIFWGSFPLIILIILIIL